MALAFATFLLCSNKQTTDSCGACANCQKMERMVHPDVHYFYPKPTPKAGEYDKANAETLKKWREFARSQPYAGVDSWAAFNGFDNKNLLISKEDSRQLIKTVSMKSFEGDFKILILWYPELMHPSAANGILKVLEEPPTRTIYLLVSYAYDHLLTTITSRTQIFNIPAFQEPDIVSYLTAHAGTSPEQALKAARLAHGSLGKALQELDQTGDMAYQKFQHWMRSCLSADFEELTKLTDGFAGSAKAAQRSELEFAITLVRECILAKVTDNALLHREGEEADFIRKFGGFASMAALEGIYELLSRTIGHLERNANAKITFMNLSLTTSQLLRQSRS